MKIKVLFVCASALIPLHLQADQQIVGNLEVTQQFTLRQDAFMEGAVWLGKMPSTLAPGVKMDVFQGQSTIQKLVIIPAHVEAKQQWVTEYGMVPDGTTQPVMVDEYDWVNQPIQVPDYDWIETTVWVDDYGPIGSHDITVDVYGDYVSGQRLVSDAVFDDFGVMVSPAQYEDIISNGVVGTHTETITDYGMTGSHPVTTSNYSPTGTTHSQDNLVWGVVGSHEEDQPVLVRSVVGGHYETMSVAVPEQRTTEAQTVYGLPVARFTAQVSDMVWKWRNAGLELMELSPGGLSLPKPGDTVGNSRAILTAGQFEQSYTSPNDAQSYDSHGVIMSKDGIRTWKDSGTTAAVNSSNEVTYNPEATTWTVKTPSSTGSVISRTTRIAATDASFAGNVEVQGIVRIKPAGDLDMGTFTNGPHP